MEIKKEFLFQIKQFSQEDNYGYFEGYASVFDVIDSAKDVVRKGAFTRTLEEKRSSIDDKNIPMLWSHKTDMPIGSFPVEYMFEDDIGLYVKGKILLSVEQGKNAYELLKSGICNRMSIGFLVKKSNFLPGNIRELLDIDLHEISLVMFPANKSAKVLGVKSMNLEDLSISPVENIMDTKQAEININQILENKEFKAEDFYIFVDNEKKEGLFIDIIDGEPQINIKSVLEFTKKDNLEKLSLTQGQKEKLEKKINSIFECIRNKTNDLSYISPFENQKEIISNFSIKDCEMFLKKAGLTNSGFKAFFARLLSLKNCGRRRNDEENKEILNQSQKEIIKNNSLEESNLTPEEINKLQNNIDNLFKLLKKRN